MDDSALSRWQERLESEFTVDGIVGGELLEVIDAEQAHAKHVGRFHGYLVLQDSFLAFMLNTLRGADRLWRALGSTAEGEWYGPTIMQFATAFRRFRAAENLLLRGYPLDGYGLLRDLKDRALVFGAMANGLTTLKHARGLTEYIAGTKNTRERMRRSRRARLREERRIFDLMMGRLSGLHGDVRVELELWLDLFNLEVHGSTLTYSQELKAFSEGAGLPLLPIPREHSTAMYLNRSHEIGWMLLRCLPFLQINGGDFSFDWARKWKVLDDSFRTTVEALTDDLGKPIGRAISTLIDTKFQFSPRFTAYYEARGEGP